MDFRRLAPSIISIDSKHSHGGELFRKKRNDFWRFLNRHRSGRNNRQIQEKYLHYRKEENLDIRKV